MARMLNFGRWKLLGLLFLLWLLLPSASLLFYREPVFTQAPDTDFEEGLRIWFQPQSTKASVAASSVLFALESPVFEILNKDLAYTDFWLTNYPILSRDYPQFTIFQNRGVHYFLGFKDHKEWTERWKHSLKTNPVTTIPAGFLLLSQVLSSREAAQDLPFQKKNHSAENRGPNHRLPSLSQCHKIFPYLLYRQIAEEYGLSFLFKPEEVLRTAEAALLEDPLLTQNLLYPLRNFATPEVLNLQNKLSQILLTPHARIPKSREKARSGDLKDLAILALAMADEEADYISYGVDYDYQELMQITEKLSGQGKTTNMDWLKVFLQYSRRSIAVPPVFEPSCRCSAKITL